MGGRGGAPSLPAVVGIVTVLRDVAGSANLNLAIDFAEYVSNASLCPRFGRSFPSFEVVQVIVVATPQSMWKCDPGSGDLVWP